MLTRTCDACPAKDITTATPFAQRFRQVACPLRSDRFGIRRAFHVRGNGFKIGRHPNLFLLVLHNGTDLCVSKRNGVTIFHTPKLSSVGQKRLRTRLTDFPDSARLHDYLEQKLLVSAETNGAERPSVLYRVITGQQCGLRPLNSEAKISSGERRLIHWWTTETCSFECLTI